jgi:predicted MPP superfamily phosphohydrolase
VPPAQARATIKPVAKLAWATDVHLDFVSPRAVATLAAELGASSPDVVLLAGDIATARDLPDYLGELETYLERPLYFVLGNHDFYHGSIDAVRARARELTRSSRFLRWLPDTGVVDLGSGWALCGHDGWGDGRAGDPERSRVALNDWDLIEDFRDLGRAERLTLLRHRGDEAAAYLRPVLDDALARFAHVLVATHVPPFREACWHEGAISDDAWLPWFTCVAVGNVLHDAARHHAERELLVVCGHTHGAGDTQILPNLRVITGGARYGAPAAQEPLVLS